MKLCFNECLKNADTSYTSNMCCCKDPYTCVLPVTQCTTSNKGAKIWDRGTKQCIRSLEAGYGLCVMFVPGNRHVIVGTRSGELQLFDVVSTACRQCSGRGTFQDQTLPVSAISIVCVGDRHCRIRNVKVQRAQNGNGVNRT